MAYEEEYPELEEDQEESSVEEVQVQMNALQQKQMQAEIRILKNRLRRIKTRLAEGGTSLKLTEKTAIKKAKKHKTLKKDVLAINTLLTANKTKIIMKSLSSSPVLFYVAIGAVILLLLMCVIVIIASIMSWLFPGIGNGEINSMFGIKGNDFYGARMVYKDDEQASINMVENYVELVENGIDVAENISTVSVDIVMPEEDYDYATFEEDAFQTAYPVLYTTIFDIAKVVYEVDNSSSYSGSSLIECTNGILYFGFGEDSIEEVKEVVKSAILSNYSSEGESADEQITSAIETLFANEKFNIRTEKLFVKDYIISGNDETIKGIQKENYVAFIFMPKTNVTFTGFSFAIGGADLSEFKIELTNDGKDVALKKEDSNYGSESEGGKQDSYIYSSSLFTNESAGVFAEMKAEDTEHLSEGMSLFDIVQTIGDYETYLEKSAESENKDCWTIKLNGVVVKMNNKEAFNFVEFETKWKTA